MNNNSGDNGSSLSQSGSSSRNKYVPPARRGGESTQGGYSGGHQRQSGGYRDSRGGDRSSRDGGYQRGGYGERTGYGTDRPRYQRGNQGGRRGPPPQRQKSEEEWAAEELRVFGEKGEVTTGINFDKYDDIPVETSGDHCPEPVSSFDGLNFVPQLQYNIKRAGFDKPTPVQKFSIPIALEGRDLMSCAQTGSGKTAAFLFPMLHIISSMDRPRRGGRFGSRDPATPMALVLAPTRELAGQIHREAAKFTFRMDLKTVVCYGGAHIQDQMFELRRGCEILVATPGRLVDLIDRGCVDLHNVRFLCLDEADRMLDMGFEPQIRQIVEEFDMPTRGDRQTFMFSATFPDQIQRLATDFLCDHIFLAVGRVGSATESVSQSVVWADDRDKYSTLLDVLLDASGLTLVFVETKRSADRLEMELRETGIPADSIHGDKSQREREYSLRCFREGRTQVLVATDVASRGLDIPNVESVINYDLPNDISSYIHRIGRTGRAGHVGKATAFFNDRNIGVANELHDILAESKQEVPEFLVSLAHSKFRSGRGGKRGGRFGGSDFRQGKQQQRRTGGGGKGGQYSSGGRGHQGGRRPQPADDSW
eukprot:TRINITY_DN695_c0_g2_i2.p1 TRINITY_DN695_c0_g2~~TRINITY_DN695_c0_g2_i2.p1  ORF type:complete len:593 (+),score=178.69 TRINITY_DN695_c0_g2_i2:62-1840(+)